MAELRQMTWISSNREDGAKILHLRIGNNAWKPYSATPHAVPDYKISGGSKGWATYQELSKAGWTLVDSETALAPPVLTSAVVEGEESIAIGQFLTF
ncbi:MAG: hypothetical protein V7L23_15355 [Nostoc sp.]|uniref:hypothetical protein n=1 Tax=Nostoc sp. TaxID=1180 RepID=UPI002FF3E249